MDFREGHVLPTIRIQKIVLDNFKNVKHGEIQLNCGRKTNPLEAESDILGIYGQNGSGKTAVIQALSILQSAMSGKSIHGSYSDCISVGENYATLSFTFDFQYQETGKTRTVVYTIKLGTMQNEEQIDLNQLIHGDDIERDEIMYHEDIIQDGSIRESIIHIMYDDHIIHDGTIREDITQEDSIQDDIM